MQVPKLPTYERVKVDLSLCKVTRRLSIVKEAIVVRPEEEVCRLFSKIASSAAAPVLVSSVGSVRKDACLPMFSFGQRGNTDFEILQIGLAAGCWVWDYLRRSYQAGLFLYVSLASKFPLSDLIMNPGACLQSIPLSRHVSWLATTLHISDTDSKIKIQAIIRRNRFLRNCCDSLFYDEVGACSDD